MEKVTAWHFVGDDKRLTHGSGLEVAPGYIYMTDGPIVLCKSGMHASLRVSDALIYAHGSILCRVALWGEIEYGSDKMVARHREVIAMRNVERELRLWGCWCVRQVWHLIDSEWSRESVVTAEAFARGDATREQLAAAGAAATSAAWAAARSTAGGAGAAAKAAAKAAARAAARAAAWAAARAAAWDSAAWAAARAAAGAALGAAAWDAGDAGGAARAAATSGDAQSTELERRMTALFEEA